MNEDKQELEGHHAWPDGWWPDRLFEWDVPERLWTMEVKWAVDESDIPHYSYDGHTLLCGPIEELDVEMFEELEEGFRRQESSMAAGGEYDAAKSSQGARRLFEDMAFGLRKEATTNA